MIFLFCLLIVKFSGYKHQYINQAGNQTPIIFFDPLWNICIWNICKFWVDVGVYLEEIRETGDQIVGDGSLDNLR